MGGRNRTWLGWPVWLVTTLLVVTAVTGSAGPIQVIWALGTISVTAWVVWFYVRGWFGGARPGGHRSGGEQPPQPSDGRRQRTGTGVSPGPS